MKERVDFYHAGCGVWVSAEQQFAAALDAATFDIEVVNFVDAPGRIAEAERAGAVSLPAFVIGNTPFQINLGASMADVKGGA